MAERYRTYDSRLRFLENNLVNHDGKLDKYKSRNDTHSAKLKMMERELQEVKAENDVLYGEVVALKSDGIKSRMENEFQRDVRSPQRPIYEQYNTKNDVINSQMQHTNDASRIVPRLKDDFDYEYDFNDVDIPESSRLKGYYRFKQIPYHNRMLLNDNYDKISPPGAAQHKKDYNRIEMHEGNFKPYASHAYHTHLTNRNPVRHRNMEFEYDTQQRLPLNIAPQTDYKSNMQRPARSESGAYLFIRTQKDAMFDIKRSFQRHKSILKMSGHLKGIATPDKISVMGDFTNWHIKSPMIRKGDYWYEQTGSRNEEYATDYVILCLWFPSVDQAKTWVHYDVDFKISSFPEPYGVELLILPINYIPMNDIECSTYVMTEYPEVMNKQALNKYVKEPMEDLLTKDSKYQRGEPFVVWTDRIVNERGMWTTSRTMVAVHRFNSLNQAREFYNDPRIENMRRELKDITKGGRHTTVMFQLVDFV
ncbi:unnamed protein product [Mytilus edulis]|uniref:Uncharacterized protein n=1 Tax=Mytilus edulis TaxID=6550 RepID=A0A8S3VEU2_MYTED|nr:unnamed protein product [Mytilus edulis]